MTNDGALNLRQLFPNFLFLPQERERSRVMAKQQHSLVRPQRSKLPPKPLDMVLPQFAPGPVFFRQCFALVHRQRRESGSDTHQNIIAMLKRPKWAKPKF